MGLQRVAAGWEPTRDVPSPALFVAVAAVSGILGAAAAYGVTAVGPKAALVPLTVVAFVLLAGVPRLTLGTLLVTTLLLENDPLGFLPFETRFYSRFVLQLAPTDFIFLALVVGTILRLARLRQGPRLPAYFGFPILLLGTAVLAGVVTSVSAHGSTVEMLNAVRVLAYLGLLPIVVVNLVREERDVRFVVIVIGAMAAYKGLEGTVAYLAGAGRTVNGTPLTYFDPTATWVVILFMLTMLGAGIARVRLPAWTVGALPLMFTAVLFSYRRSLWLAAVLGAGIVVLAASGQRARVAIPAVVALVVAGTLLASATGGPLTALQQSQSPVVKRLLTFSPTAQSNRKEDLYRQAERANLWQEIRLHPLSGLGFGVPWRSYRPVPIYFKGQHTYGHFVAFLYWLRMGILGLAAYLLMIGAGMLAGYRTWRNHPDGVVRCAGLAVMAGLMGLAVAETTGSQTGVNLRLTVIEGVVFGLLAAAGVNRGTMSQAARNPQAKSGAPTHR